MGWLKKCSWRAITCVPDGIESIVRFLDAKIGGTQTVARFHGRSILAFILPLPVYLFMVYGPSMASPGGGPVLRGGPWPALLLLFAAGIQIGYFLQNKRRGMAWLHLGLVIMLFLATWFLAGAGSTQASANLYRHYYGPLAVIAMLVAVPLACCLRRCRWFQLPSQARRAFRKAFNADSIVAQGSPRPFNTWDVLGAFVVAVLRTPLHVITPVALVVLVAPAEQLKLWAGIATLISLILFTTSNYDPERDAFVRLVSRGFLSGGTLLVTLAVIALAAFRLSGWDYVTTVLDAGSKLTIFSYIISTYALLWLYDFWLDQAALDLLGRLERSGFSIGSGRLLRHGGGRIMLVAGPGNGGRMMFEPAALLRRIAETARPADRPRLRDEAERAEQRWRAFSGICSAVLAGVLVAGGFILHHLPQSPGLRVGSTEARAPDTQLFDLVERLRQAGPRPVIMLAASGGGTRAALYTAAVLHGLHRLDALDRLVVASGVSGGSAALAYFAAHRSALSLGGDPAWKHMREILAAPFIDDVLAGAAEWRVSAGVRLGQLLTESFERRFLASGPPGSRSVRTRLEEISDLGLIFNTSLCSARSSEDELSESKMESTDEAGGRLVITNLSSRFIDPEAPSGSGWNLEFPFRVVRAPQASLFEAASLSANFPPVFPNAAVDVAGANGGRFWVTDGGAVENRGVISILLALAGALTEIRKTSPDGRQDLPDIRVVVAEASAFNPEYRSDRGIGAKFGASAQLANRLIRELLVRIELLFQAVTGRKDGVRVVYLPMPEALRAAGTFGTHWMMPEAVFFRAYHFPDPNQPAIELSKSTAVEFIDALFAPDYSIEYVRKRWPELTDAERIVAETGNPWEMLEAGVR